MVMSKLKPVRAQEMINRATQLSDEHSGYRFGQALWNVLPCEIIDNMVGTDVDFFMWTDKKRVLNIFWDKYVDYDED